METPAERPTTDEERVRVIARAIDELLSQRWAEIDELWLREIRPAFPGISDEEFMKRVAMPLSMRLLSIGVQTGIHALTRAAPVFDGPFRVVVAPSGQVSIRLGE